MKKINYLKLKFNWVSCILSGSPTNRQMQKRKRGDWNPLQLVGHTETKNKNNNNNEPKSLHWLLNTDQHHNEKIQVLQMLLPGNILDFLQAGFRNVLEKPC